MIVDSAYVKVYANANLFSEVVMQENVISRCRERNRIILVTGIYIVTLRKGTKFEKMYCHRLLPCASDTRCPLGYALFRKTLPQPLIWFRSHRLDSCKDSQHIQICISSSFPSAYFPVFTRLLFPVCLLAPSRLDLYDTSQIRSSIQWHNSSWWLDLG